MPSKNSQQKLTMNRPELLNKFYVKRDYAGLKSSLAASKEPEELEILAQIYIIEQNYPKAEKIYEKLGMIYEQGRCCLLSGDLARTKELWYSTNDDYLPLLWGHHLLQFIERYVTDVPPFFQIRSFLEVDLDALLTAKQYEFCENIINADDIMAQNNTECYKFIGRVFVYHNFFDIAKIYLEKAKNICYADPEVHFLFAKCYLAKNNTHRAIHSLETCLERANGYYPAKKLLQEITNSAAHP